MDSNSIKETINSYEEQLLQVETALLSTTDSCEIEKLNSLKSDIQQLLDLTRETFQVSNAEIASTDPLEDEYKLFLEEMQTDGAIENLNDNHISTNDLKALEGTKCKAPHTHSWGEIVHHNAIICSVIDPSKNNDIEVKIMFINPTHREMLPCPYFLDTECKFSVEQCRFSHGETVLVSSLKEYTEPNFESVRIGSKVLAKGSDKLWYRASVKRMFSQKCIVKFESNTKDVEVNFHDILPLENESTDTSSESESDDEVNYEDVINMSLVITPASQALGDWEKFTKGIGSKLMSKMGYITGSGLGKKSDGIIEPVSAVVLPAGKSLDHCMKLRENANGDKDLFSAERKLKRLQKRQEIQSQKAYERERNKVDVFNFLNNTLAEKQNTECTTLNNTTHRQQIKSESSRSLNVASLKVEEDIKKLERDLFKIRDSMKRHSDTNSQVYKKLVLQLNAKQSEIKTLKDQANNIRCEQNLRNDTKKMTIF